MYALVGGADFSPLGGLWGVQLAWLAPTLALITFGCLTALAAAQPNTGALLTGMVWLVQLVARSWFAADAIGKYTLVFMGALMPDHPDLAAKQIVLLSGSALLLLISWLWLHRQELYI